MYATVINERNGASAVWLFNNNSRDLANALRCKPKDIVAVYVNGKQINRLQWAYGKFYIV